MFYKTADFLVVNLSVHSDIDLHYSYHIYVGRPTFHAEF